MIIGVVDELYTSPSKTRPTPEHPLCTHGRVRIVCSTSYCVLNINRSIHTHTGARCVDWACDQQTQNSSKIPENILMLQKKYEI